MIPWHGTRVRAMTAATKHALLELALGASQCVDAERVAGYRVKGEGVQQ